MVRTAVAEARATIEQMKGKITATILDSPAEEARKAIHSRPEVSPLLEAPVSVRSQPPAEPGAKATGQDQRSSGGC